MSLSPFSASHRNRVTGGALALGLLTVLGVSVYGTAEGSGSGSAVVSPAGPVGGLQAIVDEGAVPWPEGGQTAVVLEGAGPVGTRGEQRPVPIASLTKVMTAHVILEEHPLPAGEPGPMIEVDRQTAYEVGVGGESTVPLRAGRRYSQRQLLEMLLIPSGNNVARLLARWDSGSQEAFAEKMRRAAARLGMKHSTYTGASGIEATTTSTATDQLALARKAMQNPVFRDIVGTRSVTVPGVGPITNTNPLLDTPGVVGIKTGSSTPAGGNLLWACEVRVGDTTRLLIGAVLHQRPNTTPSEGLRSAVDSSRRLMAGLRDSLTREG
ncbi:MULTISPECIES: D-alanyl-D-alanine carboxypeptidase family protein [Streptomyces]|uniref:D-alanyl-D-alanine carboxypeptidase (Penicillin-binding protein 5/6) n=1 Tax=Streptomyces nymphaeiformis TaxID=2663842 RepID=A0A7W7U2H1_9ACTN|nr:D-alanyl-D-alanine carboxypeptidase [Streptomyces nymphaeiformis]MBB4983828.1 D-alanyl-D-alanine carboxypeptidase (penicillin-binding protein 5/6) [Streptomyces nymphaeiformis]